MKRQSVNHVCLYDNTPHPDATVHQTSSFETAGHEEIMVVDLATTGGSVDVLQWIRETRAVRQSYTSSKWWGLWWHQKGDCRNLEPVRKRGTSTNVGWYKWWRGLRQPRTRIIFYQLQESDRRCRHDRTLRDPSSPCDEKKNIQRVLEVLILRIMRVWTWRN